MVEEDGGGPVSDRTEATDFERCDSGRDVVSGASSNVSYFPKISHPNWLAACQLHLPLHGPSYLHSTFSCLFPPCSRRQLMTANDTGTG